MNKQTLQSSSKQENQSVTDNVFTLVNTRYKPSDVDLILNEAKRCSKRKNYKTGVEYYNIPIAFDTEASSWLENDEFKRGTMYAWTIGIDGKVIFGRTYDDLLYVIKRISDVLHLYSKLRVVCYAHNLAYDFQWIARRLNFTKIFALDEREIVYAITDIGIEFRCSYILSNFSLEKVGENLLRYKVEKKVGDLDYNLIRHSQTPMTDEEIGYCINDSLVVMAYIQESIEKNNNDITKIPLTNTGYVREYFRNACLYSPDKKANNRYKHLMKTLTLELDEYKMLKDAFAGGFTHANYLYVGQVLEDVTSFDFTSSYPAVMVSRRFPMSKGVRITDNITLDQFHEYLDNYFCVFTITLRNISCKADVFDTPISVSKCLNKADLLSRESDAVINNGRLFKCSECTITITDIDYECLSWFYDFDEDDIDIYDMWVYKRGYLPTPFIKALLDLYQKKTEYKGDKEHEADYQHIKGEFNASYGMTVMDVLRDEIVYDPDSEEVWDSKECDGNEVIDKYNKNSSRFLFYAWGVAIVASARQNLYTAIIRCGCDYVYSDTDSIKLVNAKEHQDYFDEYNAYITNAMRVAMDYHHLDYSLVEPETRKHEKKPLGIWDFDGFYTRFKTLGAKRYLVEYYDEDEHRLKLKLTVSGLNAKPCFTRKVLIDGKLKTIEYSDDEIRAIPMSKVTDALTYMRKVCDFDNTKVFKMFRAGTTDDESMTIPAGKTGKSIHTYIDYETSGDVTDYLGNIAPYHEMSSIHMTGSTYKSSLSSKFASFLKNTFEKRRLSNYG